MPIAKKPTPVAVKAAPVAESAEVAAMREQMAAMQAQMAKMAEMFNKPAPTHVPVLPEDKPLGTEEDSADYLVTVLFGYGKQPANHVHWVDNIEFKGGVARDVPYSLARHLLAGTRPGGGKTAGRVMVHILPNDATPADYDAKISGKRRDAAEVASILMGADLDLLRASMGDDRFESLIADMQRRLPTKIKPNR